MSVSTRHGSRTYSGRRAEIQHDLALLEEAIFLVELDQLEGGTRAVSLLLGELVPLVETAFAVLLLDRHDVGWCVTGDVTPGVLAVVVSRAFALDLKLGTASMEPLKLPLHSEIFGGDPGR
jgi:hypothetical protein